MDVKVRSRGYLVPNQRALVGEKATILLHVPEHAHLFLRQHWSLDLNCNLQSKKPNRLTNNVPEASSDLAIWTEVMLQTIENRFVPISRSTCANPTGMILTKRHPEGLLCATSALYETIFSRSMLGDSHQAEVPELTANQTRSWVHSMEKMPYLSKDTNIAKAVE